MLPHSLRSSKYERKLAPNYGKYLSILPVILGHDLAHVLSDQRSGGNINLPPGQGEQINPVHRKSSEGENHAEVA